MHAQKLRPPLAAHYHSARVYEGIKPVSKSDARTNRAITLRAFRRMLEAAERAEKQQIAAS